MKVVVTGANPKSKNIGWIVVENLRARGHQVEHVGRSVAEHITHTPLSYADADAVIVCNGYNGMASISRPWFNAEAEKVLDVNLALPMEVASHFANAWSSSYAPLKEERRKKIVFLGSMAHRKVLTSMSAYSAAKAGLDQFTKSAAFEMSEYADVFCVHPANVDGTPMAQEIIRDTAKSKKISLDEAENHWDAGRVASRRIVSEDIANAITHLLLPESQMLSGASIEIAGGSR